MQSPHFHNPNFYYKNYEYSYNQPRSHVTGQSLLHNKFKKPLNQNCNEEHWCETCDRSFPTLDLLDKHKQQHQKCNIDGCQFIAHPKVITKHIQMQHSSGLYNKIAKLNNPEEIQKWRDERKRKYPTKHNIEKKAAEIKEKIERGEKMGLKHYGHKKPNRTVNGENNSNVTLKGRNHQRSQNHRQKPYQSTLTLTHKSAVPKKVHHVLPTADSLRILKPFAGIQNIIMEDTLEEDAEEIKCDFVIDDEDQLKLPEPDNNRLELLNGNEPKVCEALSSLMCNYQSSEEETDDIQDQLSTEHIKSNQNTTLNNTVVNLVIKDKSNDNTITKLNNLLKEKSNKSDDDSGPEETKIDKTKQISAPEQQPTLEKLTKIKRIPVKNHTKRNFIKPKHKIPSTLLQKLLMREVKQERNIILQCVRHVVKNKFFDKPN